MVKYRKQISFDLDTKQLREHYPGDNWHGAYEKIKRHMTKNSFEWRQGSVYISKFATVDSKVHAVISELVIANPWLNLCMRDCIQANISNEHSLNQHFGGVSPLI